jgi:chorismate dehydratase
VKPRISLVHYLNSVPLGWGFTEGPYQNEFDVLLASPANCADQLRDGEADIGLIPSIEYQRIPDLKIIPNIAIAARRRVKSILLVSRQPIENVRQVAADTSSRTSVALLNVLLTHFYRSHVRFSPHRPQLDEMLSDSEAALIIGDPALRVAKPGYKIYDLVAEWHKFTGKPFVFAFWAVRSDVVLADKVGLFEKSKQLGLQNIETIAARYDSMLHLERALIIEYLTDCIRYDLDPENLSGLNLFFKLAHEIGIIDKVKDLVFYQ